MISNEFWLETPPIFDVEREFYALATYTARPLGHCFREPIFVVAFPYPNALSAQMNAGKKVLALQAHRETWLNDRQRTMMSKLILYKSGGEIFL